LDLLIKYKLILKIKRTLNIFDTNKINITRNQSNRYITYSLARLRSFNKKKLQVIVVCSLPISRECLRDLDNNSGNTWNKDVIGQWCYDQCWQIIFFPRLLGWKLSSSFFFPIPIHLPKAFLMCSSSCQATVFFFFFLGYSLLKISTWKSSLRG